ncbi:MAG: ABC transporter substrate-binding protein [Oscillospiraceae bacterium]|nr:ABC transporter substrate-binding protein [Oscillospiraceae bacterium]
MTRTKAETQRLRRALAAVMAVCMALALISCGGKPETPPSAPPDAGADSGEPAKALFQLRAFDPAVDFVELSIADELGFFADEGLEIVYVGATPQGVSQYQLLEEGEIDIVYSGHPPSIAQARLAGLDVVIVAPGMVDGEWGPHVDYLVREDSPLQTLEDLRPGLKVAIAAVAPCIDGYVRYWAVQHGWDPDEIEWVTLPGSGQMEQAVLDGSIDVTTSHTPNSKIALSKGGYRSLGTTWDIFESPAAGLAVRTVHQSLIDEHPEAVQGFVNAMYRARKWANANREQAENLVSAVFGLNPGDVMANPEDENKNIDPAYMELWWEIAEAIGMWAPGDIAPEETYTNQFVPNDIPESDLTLQWDGTVKNVFH